MSETKKITAGQRWLSETEPELGLGTVIGTAGERILIRFRTAGVTRQYSLTRAPIKRIRFKQGDVLTTTAGESISVTDTSERDGLLYYHHLAEQYCETELADTIPVNDPQDRLMAAHFDPPETFELRYHSLLARETIMQSPLRGYCGARIELFPHQLYIADAISGRYVPRVMLSDQVGLGKTIEALLVIKKLILTGRINSVLIITPEHLVLQWFGELYHRFALTFAVIDQQYCHNRQQKHKDFNPFSEKQFSICSYSVLTLMPELRAQTLEKAWDLVLIDEAHNLNQAAEEYGYFKKLARLASGLMLLSAIPEYPNLEDFFARLHLLDPVLYDKYDRFFWEVDGFKRTAALAEKLYKNSKLQPEDIAFLREKIPAGYLAGDALTGAGVKPDKAARLRILEYLIDQHGMGRLLFRNTRKTISGFPGRVVSLVPLEPEEEPAAKERLLAEFRHDLAEAATPPVYCFTEDKRLTWLGGLLKKGEKVLLICTTRMKVFAIEAALKMKGFKNFVTFHEELDFLERDRRVVRFYEAEGAQLLVSSEIGSEGRNFQFCRSLVFFDLPFNPSLIEQRIGRLDRIGQKGPINIYIPYPQGSPQESIVNWFHSGLNIFNEFHDGHIQTFALYSALIKKMVLSGNFNPGELLQIISETRKEYHRVKKINEKGRDVLVELNSFDPKKAQEILSRINAQDANTAFEDCLLDLLEFYGFHLKKIDHRTYRIDTEHVKTTAFSQLVPNGFIITFDRTLATARTDYAFITIDHELAGRAIDLLLGQTTGNCVCALWVNEDAGDLLLEAVYIPECIAPPGYNTGRYLPVSPVRILVDDKLRDLSAGFPFETVGEELYPVTPGKQPGLLSRIRESSAEMLEKAKVFAEVQAASLKQKALKRADAIIGQEIIRLAALKKVNKHIKDEEILQAQKELAAVKGYIESARLRLDSLRVIQRSLPENNEQC